MLNLKAKTREEIVREFLTDDRVIQFDPYSDECEIKYRTVKVVTTRKPHTCTGASDATIAKAHKMRASTRARFESALVDSEWCSYYTCITCIVKQLLVEPAHFSDLDDLLRNHKEKPNA